MLGREAENEGVVTFWDNNTRLRGRTNTALGFIRSRERRTQIVTGFYNDILNRDPEPGAGPVGHINLLLGNSFQVREFDESIFYGSDEYLNQQC